MRIPLSWLRDYVDLPGAPADLADMITSAGLEVKSIDRIGVAGSELVWDEDKVLLARVLGVDRHPDADRLVLATVDYGADQPKVVVTGAPNLFPFLDQGDLRERGLYSPLILEGGTYLDPHKDSAPTRLRGKKLRGIYNDAMLCSPIELGLGEDHEGILLIDGSELEPDHSQCRHRPGTPLASVLGEVILDIDILPNIARCASIVGVAREVAALTDTELRYPDVSVIADGEPLEGRIRISSESPELNPRFVAILIEGVERKPAPFWMQHRLRLVGQRPIGVVVDVSNYVMLELGQPNHSFDWDFLRRRAAEYSQDGGVEIVTRLASSGERLTTLDGVERKLLPNNMLVTDPLGPLSLAGVMGGADSEIVAGTTDVLLESAAWHFINIRQTSRQLGLLSEAAFRFSRGVHPSQTMPAARRAAELLRRVAGGRVAAGEVDYNPRPAPPVTVDLAPESVHRLSGLSLSREEIAALLTRLDFAVDTDPSSSSDTLSVTVPDHRMDIDGPHDLVEEVCRMYGYDHIPSKVLSDALPPQRGNPRLEAEERIKDLLVQMELQEVMTYRLTTEKAETRALAATGAGDSYVRLVNPATLDRVVMRQSLLASVLEIATVNRFLERICIFEIGQVYVRPPGVGLPDTPTQLVIVMSGRQRPVDWQSDSAERIDYFSLKGVLESLTESLKVECRFEEGDHPTFRPGFTARLRSVDGSELGIAGEIHPLVLEEYDFRFETGQSLYAAVVDFDELFARTPDLYQVDPLPAYPSIREDLALVVAADIPAGKVEEELLKAGGRLLVGAELFDVYTGDQVGAKEKSLAYHLTLQSSEKTLTDRDAAKTRKRILRQLDRSLGARLRE